MPVVLLLIVLLSAAVVAVFLLARVRVPEGNIGVLERLGKFHKVLLPGRHFLLPLVDQVASYIPVATRQELYKCTVAVTPAQVYYITLDLLWALGDTTAENIVKVAYQFHDPGRSMEVIHAGVQNAVTAFFAGRSPLVRLNDYEPLSRDLELKLGELMNTMGYRLNRLQIKDLYLG